MTQLLNTLTPICLQVLYLWICLLNNIYVGGNSFGDDSPNSDGWMETWYKQWTSVCFLRGSSFLFWGCSFFWSSVKDADWLILGPVCWRLDPGYNEQQHKACSSMEWSKCPWSLGADSILGKSYCMNKDICKEGFEIIDLCRYTLDRKNIMHQCGYMYVFKWMCQTKWAKKK